MTAPAETHDAATCPAFGGCADCRTAKFEAASPDVSISSGSGDWLASLRADLLGPAPEADPVDYSDVPAFNAAADATLARAGAIHKQRGGEYGDTWALPMTTAFVDSVLRLESAGRYAQWRRLLVVAALIDVKLSRMGGGWKEDTCLDLLNYISAYTSWRGDL